MDSKINSVLILGNIVKEKQRIAGALGKELQTFSQRFVDVAKRLSVYEDDDDDEALDEVVRVLLNIGLESPAQEIFRRVLRYSALDQVELEVVQSPSAERFEIDFEELRRTERATLHSALDVSDPFDTLSRTRDATYRPREVVAKLRSPSTGQIITYTPGELGVELRKIWEPHLDEGREADTTEPRFLNAGFFIQGGEMVPVIEPLSLDAGPYLLGVNIGKFWGPGSAGAPFPDDLLANFFDEDWLELDVFASSPEMSIPLPCGKLQLPRWGDSKLVFFDLTPGTTPGRQSVEVLVFYRNHLLQARNTEVEVVANKDEPVSTTAKSVQDGYVTFVRSATFDDETIGQLKQKPRRLTIAVSYTQQVLGFKFFDSTEAAECKVQQLRFDMTAELLSESGLPAIFNALRTRLAETMNKYAGGIGNQEPDVLRKHLGALADTGRSFYRALFKKPLPPLEPGQIIQVAPLSAQTSAPWELLYERPIETYDENVTRLCATFREHGPRPEDCPHSKETDVVCPHGFWGYRYVIEQLPCRIKSTESTEPLLAIALPITIRNQLPLKFKSVISSGFKQWDSHLLALKGLGPIEQLDIADPFEKKQKLKELLTAASPEADLLYFYAHGGFDDNSRSFLTIGANEKFSELDLDAWSVKLQGRHPLVVLNACDSAAYTPERFENLIHEFYVHGAAGVVGTQCEVREILATKMALSFFKKFMGEQSAGQSLFEARRELLFENNDPRGLAYSLFASADVTLSQRLQFAQV